MFFEVMSVFRWQKYVSISSPLQLPESTVHHQYTRKPGHFPSGLKNFPFFSFKSKKVVEYKSRRTFPSLARLLHGGGADLDKRIYSTSFTFPLLSGRPASHRKDFRHGGAPAVMAMTGRGIKDTCVQSHVER